MLGKKLEGSIIETADPLTYLNPGCTAKRRAFVSLWKKKMLSSKKTPEQIWLACAFSSHSNHLGTPSFLSDLHTAAPHIVTRPWPNWFLFSFNIPLELAFLSTPWNKTSKRIREKNASLLTPQGGTKVSWEGPQKEVPLCGYTERSK